MQEMKPYPNFHFPPVRYLLRDCIWICVKLYEAGDWFHATEYGGRATVGAPSKRAVELALQMEPLDPNRIALLGGSHGGFICCHLIGRYPERYKVCAVRSPVINMATLLGTSDIPDWRFSALGLPYCFEQIPTAEDLAAMLLSSPITHAAKVQAPVLLYVGARDRRVSPYQAVEYYRVLRARGIPVRLLWYPEENHAINGVEAEANVFMNCAQWIMHYLSMEAGVEVQQPAESPDV